MKVVGAQGTRGHIYGTPPGASAELGLVLSTHPGPPEALPWAHPAPAARGEHPVGEPQIPPSRSGPGPAALPTPPASPHHRPGPCPPHPAPARPEHRPPPSGPAAPAPPRHGHAAQAKGPGPAASPGAGLRVGLGLGVGVLGRLGVGGRAGGGGEWGRGTSGGGAGGSASPPALVRL